MLIEIIPESYDIQGKEIPEPNRRKKNKLFHPTFPMKRFLSQPLSVKCENIHDIRKFLRECHYEYDIDQFGKDDYWLPPEEFEKTKKGDCEDYSLWVWRQLMNLGYKCRFVAGHSGKYGNGHAWVTLQKDGKDYLVEPLIGSCFKRLPRLNMIRYEPETSVEWDGEKLYYFKHKVPESKLSYIKSIILFLEWLIFWTGFWLKVIGIFILSPYLFARKFINKKLKKPERKRPLDFF
jgi:transglutaminase superfamily protein